ncbi:fatty acid desaturase [Tabrizicola sp.]|uniref:fatty acid desaturase n=1 Tax=Tabrizicola sp. TaxID=2005166 RepID=UPI0035B2AB40
MQTDTRAIEWPTVILFAVTWGIWIAGTVYLWPLSPILAVLATGLAIAQLSSLTHEVLHGHPFRSQLLSEALVFPATSIFIPYLRFKDTHLQHHNDPALTDPYDDPESNFFDPAVWARLSAPMQAVLRFNNTLLGRILIGPVLGTASFLATDWRLARKGDARVRLAWALHLPGLVLVAWWLLALGTMPVWAYLVAAYVGTALLKIRTYLEHRAHEAARARTVIIESRGPFSLLFLNNNFHVVHHMHPAVAWYELPAMYAARKEHYQRRNEAYVYPSYTEIFRRYLFSAKDPVPHPIWPVYKGAVASDDAAELGGGAGIIEERHAGLVPARH